MRDLCLNGKIPQGWILKTTQSTPNTCTPGMCTHGHTQGKQILEKVGWWTHQPIPQLQMVSVDEIQEKKKTDGNENDIQGRGSLDTKQMFYDDGEIKRYKII